MQIAHLPVPSESDFIIAKAFYDIILGFSVKARTRNDISLQNKNAGTKKSRGPQRGSLAFLPDILFIPQMGSIYFCGSSKEVRIRFYFTYCCSYMHGV